MNSVLSNRIRRNKPANCIDCKQPLGLRKIEPDYKRHKLPSCETCGGLIKEEMKVKNDT